MKKNILEIIESKKCCGCGACINICPTKALTYGYDKYYFTEPKIDINKCIFCGKCLSICPIRSIKKNNFLESYAAISIDKNIRINSSSGGIFANIAKSFLRAGGVVYGCSMDSEFQVKHIRIVDQKDLYKIMRSKYVQSYMGDIYIQIKKDLKENKKVLFSGTPCQVSAINNFLSLEEKNKFFTIDIICHGVPSQYFYDSYIKFLSNELGIIKEYKFRAKKVLNNGMNCFSSYKLKKNDKEIFLNWPEDTFNYLYMKSYIYRDSCYKCVYAETNRPSDITLGDYWSFNKYHNEFKIGETVSCVLVNSQKGKEMLLKIGDKLKLVSSDIDNIKRHNSCLFKPSVEPLERINILKTWLSDGFFKLDKEYKEKNKKNIIKYNILGKIPIRLLNIFNYYRSK